MLMRRILCPPLRQWRQTSGCGCFAFDGVIYSVCVCVSAHDKWRRNSDCFMFWAVFIYNFTMYLFYVNGLIYRKCLQSIKAMLKAWSVCSKMWRWVSGLLKQWDAHTNSIIYHLSSLFSLHVLHTCPPPLHPLLSPPVPLLSLSSSQWYAPLVFPPLSLPFSSTVSLRNLHTGASHWCSANPYKHVRFFRCQAPENDQRLSVLMCASWCTWGCLCERLLYGGACVQSEKQREDAWWAGVVVIGGVFGVLSLPCLPPSLFHLVV